jgi:hypothetical protein
MIVLGTLLFGSVSAQAGKEGPVKIDEFGQTNHEDYSARLDNIAIELQNDPTAQGYFIFYNGRKSLPGAALRYMKRLRNYMEQARGLDASRLTVLEGGRRDEILIQFWLSPSGVAAPVPSPAVSEQPESTGSYLYDVYSCDCDRLFRPRVSAVDIDECEYGGSSYEDRSARLDGFIKAVGQTPGGKARLVVYSRPRDARSKVQKIIQQEKAYLVTKGLKASTIITVTQGMSKHRSVELWIVAPAVPK